jgi:iron complex outermembrane receptor protein
MHSGQERARGFLEGRLLYSGAVPVDDENSDQAEPYAMLDLRAGLDGWRVLGRDLSLFGGITNSLDRSYTTAVSVNAFGGRFFEPGPGRSTYLGIRASFLP